MSPPTDLEFSAGRTSLFVAALAICLCVLSAGWLISLGCHPVAKEPTATFTVHPAGGSEGVNVTHAGGDEFDAGDIYVRTPGMNASFSSLSPAYTSSSAIGPEDSITLAGLPKGAYVEIVWFNPTVEYDGSECMDQTPYTQTLASFTVGNNGTYLTPPTKADSE